MKATSRALIGLGVIAAVSTLVAIRSTFTSASVCAVCGSIEHSVEWQLPLTTMTYWRTTSVEATPLSVALQADGLVTPHAHDFHFAQGGGNGVTCAIGADSHFWRATESAELGSFLHNVATYRGVAKAQQCLRLALDADYSRSILDAITVTPAPSLKTAAEFDAWWATHRDDILGCAPELEFVDRSKSLGSPPSPPR